MAGGLDDESRRYYPRLTGWTVGALGTYQYKLNKTESFGSNAAIVQSWSSTNNTAATLTATEAWQHTFDKRTSSSVAAGISITRFAQAQGLRGFSIFPNFQATIAHQANVARGGLSLAANAYSSPVLDPLRALVDPRVGVGSSIMWARKRFSCGVSGTAALSLAPDDNNAGAVNALQGTAQTAYQIGKLTSIDAGVRYARQSVQRVQVLPSTWSAFVGLTFGVGTSLAGSPR
jgi:hypothetical protein